LEELGCGQVFPEGNLNINCPCTVQQVIEGFEPEERKDNISKQLVQDMTYKEWIELRIAS
jgi:hypothetical protein